MRAPLWRTNEEMKHTCGLTSPKFPYVLTLLFRLCMVKIPGRLKRRPPCFCLVRIVHWAVLPVLGMTQHSTAASATRCAMPPSFMARRDLAPYGRLAQPCKLRLAWAEEAGAYAPGTASGPPASTASSPDHWLTEAGGGPGSTRYRTNEAIS
ncbi:hypothetical protein Micbo1qcDRAFT_42100 [Microdochium bolleyi]|uniref:Uncharacterized protein n=1 Tax=Microdochium bolleyi TaxID=196109 RepID=A0A136JAR2_9PEZI|nr:hypothetical protein Micbo1qcDRAFT_42100 [Microdochium bolleyi]